MPQPVFGRTDASQLRRCAGGACGKGQSLQSTESLKNAKRLCPRPPNGSHAKLCGQGPRAEAAAARRLPRMTFEESSDELQPA
jgi:hypothetical protein